MNAQVEKGAIIQYKATEDVAYHKAVVVGELLGIARAEAKADEVVALDVEGVFALDKKDKTKLTVGTRVWYNDGVTATKAEGKPTGIVFADTTADDKTVNVKINVQEITKWE